VFGEYFRLGPITAYGLYARNARGITLHDVRFQVSTPELRPAIVFDHVEDASFNGLAVEGSPGAESVLRFTDSKHVLIAASRVLSPSSVFLQLEGEANDAIIVDGGDLFRASAPVAFKRGATPGAVRVRGLA